jgi:hypothetical protein
VVAVALLFVLVACAAGCGSSGPKAAAKTGQTVAARRLVLRLCLRKHGYAVSPEPASDLATAPRRFEFVSIWNVLNPNRVALALTFSSDLSGAEQAVVWTQHENAQLGRGAVAAPVVRIGKVNVLWTAKPDPVDVKGIYPCVRAYA